MKDRQEFPLTNSQRDKKQRTPAETLEGMWVVDAKYIGDMSPALPVSVPLCPPCFFFFFATAEFIFNMFLRAVFKCHK